MRVRIEIDDQDDGEDAARNCINGGYLATAAVLFREWLQEQANSQSETMSPSDALAEFDDRFKGLIEEC